jgi:hypothetical protein
MATMATDWGISDNDKLKALCELDHSHGIVSVASRNAGIARSTFYRWMDEDETFKAAVEEIREASIDHVENKLFNLIDSGDTGSTIFFLKTRGKKRGYVERTELTGADGKDLPPVSINIIQPGTTGE